MKFFCICFLSLASLSLLTSASYAQNSVQAATTQKPQTDDQAVDNVAELTEAFDNWMLRAYEGDRDAQFKVALMFSDGTGTEQDIEQAVYWYIQAARQGLASAQYNLGHKYLNGEGVKKDVNQAIQWWLKAAEQEHELAQFNVARAYYGGIGVEKNVDQARYWFRKAAANNEPRSEKILTSIFQEEPGTAAVATLSPESTTSSTAESTEESAAAITQNNETIPTITPQTSQQPDQAETIEIVAKTDDTTLTQGAQESTEVKPDSAIAIYNRPDKNSMLVSIVPKNADISVIKTTPKWLKVSIADGFPVWVYRAFVKTNGNIATITGNNVNARAVPLVLRGSVVGQLFKGAKLQILETQEEWIRLQSSANFTAWIERSEFNQTPASAVATKSTNVDVKEVAVETVETANKPEKAEKIVTENVEPTTSPATASNQNKSEKYAFKNARNDNDWLFGLSDAAFTIQLASFSADAELNKFLTNQSLVNDPNVKQFISNRNGIEWKYLLYGSFANRAAAEDIKKEKAFKNAWIRKASQIRKNRCLAWKTILPTPAELKTYCQK